MPSGPLAPDPPGQAGPRALLGWMLFDWACQPFFTLVTTFIFAPYFAGVLAPDAVRGQALWGYATAAAGFVLALLSPLLGSLADAHGARKPWIAAFCLVLGVASAALWFARPGLPQAVPLALGAFAVAMVAAEVAAVFNNAMMVRLVGARALGRLSGRGWAIGYAGGFLSLLLMLGLIMARPETGRTLVGLPPLFGLDPGLREGDRASGPFTAVWLLVFVWPLFAFTPDAPASGLPLREAVRQGWRRLALTLSEVRCSPPLLRFLAANLIYQDAIVAVSAFGGIYGAGMFGWSATELGLFGIMLTVIGTIGSLIGGRLDDRFGARSVIMGCLVILVAVCLGFGVVGKGRVLFLETGPGGPGLYGSLPEKIFLVLGLVYGGVIGPLQASARSLVARSVPEADAGRYFGLLAMSGKATSFLAPLMVAAATQATGSLAAAPLILVVFFIAAALLMRGALRV